MWFADKLGPVPKASPLGKAEPQMTKPQNQKTAPPARAAAAAAQPGRGAPEQPKKKGWF